MRGRAGVPPPPFILNKATRCIIIESGVLRHRQRFQFRRGQRVLTPEVFGDAQYAVVKGLSPSHLRRVLYILQIQHVRAKRRLYLLKLDQSNAYGQTDLTALSRQASHDALWHWACQQSRKLYSRLLAYVVTVQGLTAAYSIASGLIQGGGLDPFWYVFYTALLVTALNAQCQQVPLKTISGQHKITALMVVDDAIVAAPTQHTMQADADVCVTEIGRLNGQCNPDKFGLMAQRPSKQGAAQEPSHIRVENQDINSAGPQEYVKMVGGNVHLAASPTDDEREARKASRKVMSRLAQHPTSVSLLRVILDGMITVRWVYRRQVDWPSDCIAETKRQGPVSQVTSTVAGAGRLALRLPRRTPRSFVFGAANKGRLAVPKPGDKLWRSAVMELWKVAHSPNRLAREACQRELQRAFSGATPETVAKGKVNDFGVFAAWCTTRQWTFRLYRGNGGTWAPMPLRFQTAVPILLLVADCSTSRDQCTWGLGAVLATIEGVILRRWRAQIRAQYSSTMDMEATAVAESLHTTVRSVQQEGVMIWPWCDNQSAAVHCNARNLQAQHWQPRTQIAASLELLYECCPFRCGWCPAEHDTKTRGLLSALNKEADAESKAAWKGDNASTWRIPSTWCHGGQPTPVIEGPHGVIADLKRAIRAEFSWTLYDRRSTEEKVLPFQFWDHWTVPAPLTDLWGSHSALHPHVSGHVQLIAQYWDWSPLVHDDHDAGVCGRCGQEYVHRLCHSLRDCPQAQIMLHGMLRVLASLLQRVQRDGVYVYRTWSGLQILTPRGDILVLAGHHCVLASFMASAPPTVALWPLMMGMTPNADAHSLLQVALDIPAAALCAQVTSAMAQLISEEAPDVAALLRGVSSIPPERSTVAHLQWDPRLYPHPASVFLSVPCTLVSALLSMIPNMCRVPVYMPECNSACLAVTAWPCVRETDVKIGGAGSGWQGFGLDMCSRDVHIALWQPPGHRPPLRGRHCIVRIDNTAYGVTVSTTACRHPRIVPQWRTLLVQWFVQSAVHRSRQIESAARWESRRKTGVSRRQRQPGGP